MPVGAVLFHFGTVRFHHVVHDVLSSHILNLPLERLMPDGAVLLHLHPLFHISLAPYSAARIKLTSQRNRCAQNT